MERRLRLGTRGSPLALTQANLVKQALLTAHGWGDETIEIVTVKTSGDRIQDRPLADVGGKALWTKELDLALDERRIDFAVHSMKDVETIRPDEIVIAAMLPRADVRDRLIGAESIAAIRQGGRVGTSSPRRSAQILRLRPDCEVVLFRGNVDTRLAKLAAGEADATLLAAAGLERLGKAVGAPVPVDEMLPAPAQGAVGIEARRDDAETRDWLAAIDDLATSRCVRAERALLARLGADCRSPVAALAQQSDGGMVLRAQILLPDGSEAEQGALTIGDPSEASDLAAELLARASDQLRAHFQG
ncbi:hydroxymethylbilane synthase [Sphingomonas sp. ID1715]|uniref:hydroxymethylbilane synthase n=1 Tax=Sphingomonas sp. ID1715 TaxID=1656898 RepID=UPI0014880CE7|nr:hydroxymethylbilane synthase [Sphingomonas sp. ID1715]NNM78201.1 hydroxymethylbilane synthase [Sphingomonas sp. ID1715]